MRLYGLEPMRVRSNRNQTEARPRAGLLRRPHGAPPAPVASDDLADSNIATVSITVTENAPPVAADNDLTTPASTPLGVTLDAFDADGDELTFAIVDPPSHGALSGTAPNLTYTPASGYIGPDSISYTANDGLETSNVGTISITVFRALSIGDASIVEGNSGSTSMTFTVALDPPSTGEVSVHVATSDDSAGPDDYVSNSDDLVFPPGSTSQTFVVQILGDTTAESEESFAVTLTDPVGAALGAGEATGLIIDNDRAGDIRSTGPLTRITVSPYLNCAVGHIADSAPEFYGDTACGTFLSVGGTLYGPQSVPAGGSGATAWTPVSQTATSGSGTSADPWTIVTVVDAGATGVRVTQTDTYVQGSESYKTSVAIADSSGTARSAVLFRAADCFLQNSDLGF